MEVPYLHLIECKNKGSINAVLKSHHIHSAKNDEIQTDYKSQIETNSRRK